MSDPVRRALRGLLQLIVSGGLTGLISALVGGLTPQAMAVALAVWQVIVTLAQNALEDAGTIPALLKAPASSGANPIPDGDAA